LYKGGGKAHYFEFKSEMIKAIPALCLCGVLALARKKEKDLHTLSIVV
jgi:hypothetical protein